MKILLHDLSKEEMIEYRMNQWNEETRVLTKTEKEPHQCIGCFGCWVKKPGECVIEDGYQRTGALFGNCNEVIIISQSQYGEFSPYVKTVLDRSISVVHPYFVKREGKMHHKLRYKNHPKVTVYIYGDDITDEEKKTLELRVKALGINFGTGQYEVNFLRSKAEIGGIKRW